MDDKYTLKLLNVHNNMSIVGINQKVWDSFTEDEWSLPPTQFQIIFISNLLFNEVNKLLKKGFWDWLKF